MQGMKEEQKAEYELALKIGQRRFGSACEHLKVKNGVCIKCLRKVIDRR